MNLAQFFKHRKIIAYDISMCFFHFFYFLGCYWGKVQKMTKNDKKFLLVGLHISGTIHYMIVIYGTQV